MSAREQDAVVVDDTAAAGSQNPPAPAGYWWLRVGRGSVVSLLVHRRTAVVGLVLVLVTLLVAFLALGMGNSSYGYRDIAEVLAGGGRRSAHFVIFGLRMPRIVLAVLVGAALGASGAVFQALTRNPLGSPDLIGFTMGAQTGILVAVLLFGGAFLSVTVAALIGGLATGALIWVFSFRGGFGGLRLVLAGIAISSMLGSFNRWLIVRADADSAYGALKAATGTLSDANWGLVATTGPLMVLTLVLVFVRGRDVRALHLGLDLATSLGTRVNRAQALLVLLGTALVALATMAAGPLTFIALVAPHVARMLARTAAATPALSAAVGAVLLLGADVVSQTLLESLPVGTVTASVGGLYFMGLLLVEARKKRL